MQPCRLDEHAARVSVHGCMLCESVRICTSCPIVKSRIGHMISRSGLHVTHVTAVRSTLHDSIALKCAWQTLTLYTEAACQKSQLHSVEPAAARAWHHSRHLNSCRQHLTPSLGRAQQGGCLLQAPRGSASQACSGEHRLCCQDLCLLM